MANEKRKLDTKSTIYYATTLMNVLKSRGWHWMSQVNEVITLSSKTHSYNLNAVETVCKCFSKHGWKMSLTRYANEGKVFHYTFSMRRG